MSELISGKEAKLAWANGKKLQIANTIVGEDFYDIDDSNTTLNIFDLDFYQFRLKPRTITLNNIEIPAPFEPKEDCQVWIIDDGKTDNYRKYNYEVEGDKINIFIFHYFQMSDYTFQQTLLKISELHRDIKRNFKVIDQLEQSVKNQTCNWNTPELQAIDEALNDCYERSRILNEDLAHYSAELTCLLKNSNSWQISIDAICDTFVGSKRKRLDSQCQPSTQDKVGDGQMIVEATHGL